ncbi:hypothetical protein D1872_287730 [compost metagenome]
MKLVIIGEGSCPLVFDPYCLGDAHLRFVPIRVRGLKLLRERGSMMGEAVYWSCLAAEEKRSLV